jgi:hypothetical protein
LSVHQLLTSVWLPPAVRSATLSAVVLTTKLLQPTCVRETSAVQCVVEHGGFTGSELHVFGGYVPVGTADLWAPVVSDNLDSAAPSGRRNQRVERALQVDCLVKTFSRNVRIQPSDIVERVPAASQRSDRHGCQARSIEVWFAGALAGHDPKVCTRSTEVGADAIGPCKRTK